MNIGLDFGGVIANHQTKKLETVQSFGVPVSSEAEVVRAVLLPRIGKLKYDLIVRQTAKETQGFPTTKGVRDALDQLRNQGHKIHIVSTQKDVSEDELSLYLKKNNLEVTSVTVVTQDDGKLYACKKLNIDVFLDDSVSVLESLYPLSIPLFLAKFVTDYSEKKLDFIKTVESWPDFVNEINDL